MTRSDKDKLKDIENLLEWWEDWIETEEKSNDKHKDLPCVKRMARALKEHLND